MIAMRPTLYALPLIGWKEDVALPQLGEGKIEAKIDTGARTAALHADDIEVVGRRVLFRVGSNRLEAGLHDVKRIKSSNGHSEIRAVIETEIQIGVHLFAAAITLTDRGDMGVPMLLGRDTIKGRFMVNPARSFIISRRKLPK